MEREEDGLTTELLTDTTHGGGLLLLTWAGGTVAATTRWPSDLEVDTLLAWAKRLDNVQLSLGELTASLSRDVGVEEWVDVSTHNIDNIAKGGGMLLKDVQWLSGGDWAVIAGATETLLSGMDEASKLGGGAEASEDGLVTDDDEGDDVPVLEVDELVNLWSGTGKTSVLDEDTDDNVKAVGNAAGRDVLEAVAVGLVGGVETDGGESLVLNHGEIGHDLSGALALSIVGVWGVGNGPVVSVVTEGWRAGRGLNLLWSWSGGNWLWCCSNFHWLWCSNVWLRCLNNWSWGNWLRSRSWESWSLGDWGWADVDVVWNGNGHDLLWLGVGTWGDNVWGWVDEDGGLNNGGSCWSNGVGTGRWADVGGLANGRGNNTISGLDNCDWADNGGGGLDDGGNTTESVSSGWNSGGGGLADGGLVGHGDGGRWNGVGSWSWEDGNLSGWLWDDWDDDGLNWSWCFRRWLWCLDDWSWWSWSRWSWSRGWLWLWSSWLDCTVLLVCAPFLVAFRDYSRVGSP